MITEQDLNEAIAACQGKINPNSSDCIKLAAFYTIKNELYGDRESPQTASYSFTPAPTNESIVSYNGNSEFSNVINGRRSDGVWAVMEELMETLKAIYPRLYNATLDKIDQ